MNRRQFFKRVTAFAVVAPVTLPTEILNYNPVSQVVVNDRKPKRKLKAVWTIEGEQDLLMYHGCNFIETGVVYAPYIPIIKRTSLV
jgi:hypothetical protein